MSRMTEPSPDTSHAPSRAATPAKPRRLTLSLALSVLALAGTALLWTARDGWRASDAANSEELGKLQRRIATLEDRLQRERDEMLRLGQKIGAGSAAEDTLTGRINKLEEALAKMPGAGQGLRFAWLLAQAEYYMRVANAQETLAGDPTGALTALKIADEHLRDAADPRLTGVRKLLADEIAALRNVPQVDVEGLVLKLGALADSLESLPRRQTVPAGFAATPAAPEAALRGWDRAVQSLRNALLSIISVRRSDAPVSPLMSDEAVALLLRSLELELQMARLALLRGESPLLQDSLQRVKRGLEQHFDTTAPAGASALALVNELLAAPTPGALPDISASLTELLRIRERERAP
jgi:uroporphyrin-3 C-methyltransferase